MKTVTVPSLYWNAWAEVQEVPGQSEPSRNPAPFIRPGQDLIVAVDLAAFDYSDLVGNIRSVSGGPAFTDTVRKWIATTQSSAEIDVVLLVDAAYFSGTSLREGRMRVSLDKIREFASQSSSFRPTALPTPSSPALFGRVAQPFSLKARDRTGWAPLTIAIWVNGRPVEDFSFAVCISPSATARSSDCRQPEPMRSHLGGFDSLRAARHGQPRPDAALDLLKLGNDARLFAILSLNGSRTTWPLDRDFDSLRTLMGEALFDSFARAFTDEDWLRSGKELRGLLFPTTEPVAVQAKEAFNLAIAQPRPDGAPPSFFARMYSTGVSPVVFPLGALALDDSNLGLHARLELPLANQSYSASAPCAAEWAVLAPPTGYGEKFLAEARGIADPTLRRWEALATPNRSFGHVGGFADWVGRTEPAVPTMLSILAHHKANGIHFVDQDAMTSAGVSRLFGEPSVVLFNACGVARTSTHDFIDAFNKRGVTSIVTTITEVEVTMAGDFMNCWDQQLVRLPADGGPIGDVFWRSIACLRDLTNDAGGSRYGANVLKYMLLGDSATRVCAQPIAARVP